MGAPLEDALSSHNRRKAIRKRMADTGENRHAALNAVAEQRNAVDQSVPPGPRGDAYGWHEFDYASGEDLFRCRFCLKYEVEVRVDVGPIAPCTVGGQARAAAAAKRL